MLLVWRLFDLLNCSALLFAQNAVGTLSHYMLADLAQLLDSFGALGYYIVGHSTHQSLRSILYALDIPDIA